MTDRLSTFSLKIFQQECFKDKNLDWCAFSQHSCEVKPALLFIIDNFVQYSNFNFKLKVNNVSKFSLVLWCTCQGLFISGKPGSSRPDPVSTRPFQEAHFSRSCAVADRCSDPGEIPPALHRSPHHHQGQVWRTPIGNSIGNAVRKSEVYFWWTIPLMTVNSQQHPSLNLYFLGLSCRWSRRHVCVWVRCGRPVV